jgi:hypothetical protein
MSEFEKEISFPDGGMIASDLGRNDAERAQAEMMRAYDDFARLRASHGELLAAAKVISREAGLGQITLKHLCELDEAIAKAEELAQ